jgi:hypothetical protein
LISLVEQLGVRRLGPRTTETNPARRLSVEPFTIPIAMASAASRSAQLILLISTCCFLLPLSLDAQETNNNTVASPPPPQTITFSFNFSDTSSYDDVKRDLRLQGDASRNGNLIDLNIDNRLDRSTGRMSYNYPVPFYYLASFSTRFTFEIVSDDRHPGDGMAFFLSGYPSIMGSGGGLLGLFSDPDTTLSTSAAPFIAVEFDTYQNEWDPDATHIGIDIKSIVSSNTTSLPNNLTLNGTMTATITFDSITGMLVASLLFHDRPFIEPVVVSFELQDPKSWLPPEVAVGFAASAGIYVERHQILTWSFNSTFAAPTPPKKGMVVY